MLELSNQYPSRIKKLKTIKGSVMQNELQSQFYFASPPPLSLSHCHCSPRIARAKYRRTVSAVKSLSTSTMEPDVQNAGNLKQNIGKLFEEALRTTFPDELDVEPAIAPCQNPEYGDYQCNNAMGLWSKVKGKGTQFNGPRPIGEAIVDNLPPSEMIESPSVAGAGFINIIVSDHWMARSIHKMLVRGIETWAPELPVKRAVVDFSSPNIAKEMHVGHLRSTIIGDTLARMLEYSNVEVLRRNHVGDWGTQIDMILCEFHHVAAN